MLCPDGRQVLSYNVFLLLFLEMSYNIYKTKSYLIFPLKKFFALLLVFESNRITSSKKFHLFYTKKTYFFFFFPIIFTKYSHQFIYSTRYFNKIFILHQFFIIFPNGHTFLI